MSDIPRIDIPTAVWAEPIENDMDSYALREKEQDLLHRKQVFKIGGWFLIGFISLAFVVAVASVFLVAFCKANWHILFASTALLIPPTVLSIALIRGVYRVKEENTELPAAKLIEETVKESIKALRVKPSE